ncbi:2-oxoglutarate dehydrogenase [Vibrio harveyi]|uniref:Cystatin domain protein n=1 Tax=Vibrio harveyi TaxID=669 RepID=A0A454CPY4_VIBHA|nr:cystatin domain protein [Vibrio harveyi]GBL01019.1 2-oxoglutarate dehydrogenase [Vibrio harveyi]
MAPTQSQSEANPICSAENLAGGWSQGEVTPEAQQALDFVLGQMNTAAKLKEILSVRTQVVNGINYAIEFEMDNGEVWNTIVYRSLKGDMEMTQPAQQGRLCP